MGNEHSKPRIYSPGNPGKTAALGVIKMHPFKSIARTSNAVSLCCCSWPEDEDDLSAARAEQKRAMSVASELTRTPNGKAADKKGTATDAEMDIKLPGGGTLGAGAVTAKDAPAGIVVRTSRVSSRRPWRHLHCR